MLNTQQIMEIIPHRYPFLLVDKAEIHEDGRGATGYKNVTMNEPFFQGHFPGLPVMPGVLIIEALAQVGAIAVPGDTLKLECKLVKQRGPIGIGEAVATVDGKVVAKAELTFAIG